MGLTVVRPDLGGMTGGAGRRGVVRSRMSEDLTGWGKVETGKILGPRDMGAGRSTLCRPPTII